MGKKVEVVRETGEEVVEKEEVEKEVGRRW